MLGRKDFTQQEIDHAKATIGQQLAAYDRLAGAVADAAGGGDEKAGPALEDFGALFFTNLVLALDRPFVHRLRVATGKDGNPLNEVELLVDSLINNDGVLRGNNVIKLDPGETVLGLRIGDRISLTRADFGRLAEAFFAELERKFG